MAAVGAVGAVERAEAALLLADFAGAERRARRVCALPGATALDRERALIVAIQALHETQRLASARRLLRDCCGESLAAAPPHAALLWLSLAIDEHEAEARRELQALLDTCQPAEQEADSGGSGGSGGGPGAAAGAAPRWTRRQYLALIHLYVFEVLLRELREPAAVMRWVQETRLPLSAPERRLLLDELRQQQAQQAQQAQAAAAGGHLLSDSPEPLEDVPAAAGTAGAAQGSEQEGEQLGWKRLGLRPRHQQHAAPPAAAAEAEIVPAEADCDDAAAGQPFAVGWDWLERCQQTATAVLGPLLGLGQRPDASSSGGGARSSSASSAGRGIRAPAPDAPADPAASLQLLGGSVLGAALLYSLYAERQALRQGAGRARRAAADLLRMALGMGVDPMAALR